MKFFRNDFVVAFFILIAYLLTNGYIYGWDDQHLEIPLLKHLIDPSLYQGDYYVESLAKNFVSYLYPILAKLITIKQIPAVYLALFLIARYALFFWVYRLWQLIAGGRFAALCATLMFFLLGRTEEFLYRTFSHQELSLAFIFAGIYYFYRERYLVAALIFGFAANFHAIYSLFPIVYLLAFLVLFHPQRWAMAFKTGFVFTVMCLPFLLWEIPKAMADKIFGPMVPPTEWIPLYLLSCPQNFIFQEAGPAEVLKNTHLLIEKLTPYLFLTGLYVFHVLFNPLFRRDQKAHVVVWASWALIGVSFIFTYIHPSRFVLDLNFVRCEQYVRFLLMGYTTVFIVQQVERQKSWLALLCGLFFITLGTIDLIALMAVAGLAIVFMLNRYAANTANRYLRTAGVVVCVVFAGIFVYLSAMELKAYIYLPLIWKKFFPIVGGVFLIFGLIQLKPKLLWLRRCFVIAPLLGVFILFCEYHYHYLKAKTNDIGFWQMQRNWEDMQHYVHDHTAKDVLILTPYNTDVGGFRIHSERKVLVCYRDCGIIGFDYQAARQWHKRVGDIEPFKLYANGPVDGAVLTAIFKYKVDYIVFMKYYEPRTEISALRKMYQNEVFSLYKVNLPGKG